MAKLVMAGGGGKTEDVGGAGVFIQPQKRKRRPFLEEQSPLDVRKYACYNNGGGAGMVAAVYTVKFSANAVKDLQRLKRANLSAKAKQLIDIVAANPYQNPPPYEKLIGRLSGKISRRINIKHRLVYTVSEEKKEIIVSSMWSHYEHEK